MDDHQRQKFLRAIGQAISARRQAANLSQEDVGERLGISREAVSRLETAVSVPSVVRLAELADIFDCPIEDLLSATSPRKADQAQRMFDLLGACSDKDREMLLSVVSQLATSLAAKQITEPRRSIT